MGTQVWFRNPANYIRELVECGQTNIAWDRGILVKKKIDPVKFASLYFGETYRFRLLMVGSQGTAELRNGDTLAKPTAVYPTWTYGESAAILEEIVERPVGLDYEICNDPTLDPDERPVFGQEHRVVVTGMPVGNSGPGRQFFRYLKELQEEFPECIIHVHGLYGWKLAFGTGFAAADVDPRVAAQKGKVHLPSGSEILYERAQANPKWVTTLGFKPVDLAVPRNRCMFNIKSAVWAGDNYDKLFNFRVNNNGAPVDTTSPDAEFKHPETKSHMTKPLSAKDADRFLCNTCSLQTACKYFREGAVCTVPGAEPTRLASFFKTRDSSLIIEGLGTLVAAGANRLESGMRDEETFGETNPEVTRMMSQVFDQGVKLAKLVDPALRGGGANVQVNIGGQQQIQNSNPQELVARVFRELKSQGIAEEDITAEMVQGILDSSSQKSIAPAVQSTVISERIER